MPLSTICLSAVYIYVCVCVCVCVLSAVECLSVTLPFVVRHLYVNRVPVSHQSVYLRDVNVIVSCHPYYWYNDNWDYNLTSCRPGVISEYQTLDTLSTVVWSHTLYNKSYVTVNTLRQIGDHGPVLAVYNAVWWSSLNMTDFDGWWCLVLLMKVRVYFSSGLYRGVYILWYICVL